ncbi:DNA-binding CsgD family transcriptional regulator [Chryseobacterium bernardetii]|uniref:Regulatory LuxR family protein n=3 Tax=Chryseobacterium TaxID=59732 RepID=A0A543EKJ3_9FLAO|nr:MULTISPECIES: LuxR C-terminal-related transcriptional regulator [Chryseobacterium]MDR6372095.1 DNA-binding CsgD family transcriptional regulator [Chryseobacterium vietnamense]MDR6442522.1 DNA-binding CsgD family transcriptional regulator [Chryseobacterium bernardetii]MDR6458545.1 DNA-binding CsgD family transcriptional regulator [Chryseobacterium vietnamense]MDR6487165.1 DNA-binding CsgD family transcriptional regulator [Chryseobacterium vietnamense]TQM22096.1 regulatory LuxR family protein
MMKKLTVLFFFISSFFYAQHTEEEMKNILFDIDFSSAGPKEIEKIDSLIAVCKKDSYNDCVALGYLKIANIYDKMNDTKKSFYYINKVEKENLINSDTDFEVIFYVHLQKSFLYRKLGERVASFKELDEIYDDAMKTGNAYFIYLINRQYADKYIETNKQLALKYSKIAYQFSKIYRENKGKRYRIDKNRLSNSYKTSAYLGGIYTDLNKLDSARIYIEEAIQNEKKVDDISLKYITSLYAGRYFRVIKNVEQAQYYLWSAKNIAKNYFKSENYQIAVGDELNALYESIGQKDSIGYYSNWLVGIEEVNREQNQTLNDTVDKQNELEKSNIKKETKGLFLILSVSIGVCLLFIFLFLYYYRKHKSKNLDKIDIPHQPSVDESAFKELIQLAKENNPEFLTRFNESYPRFSEELLKDSLLKISEIRFCAYLYLNFSTKEIAEYTFTSVRTVQTKKYNLRKKLNIPGDMDIYVWFSKLLK